jgi:hypothetical protein
LKSDLTVLLVRFEKANKQVECPMSATIIVTAENAIRQEQLRTPLASITYGLTIQKKVNYDCDAHGYLHQSESNPVEIEIKGMTKPKREGREELEVKGDQPEEISHHQTTDIWFNHRDRNPDKNSFKHKEPDQSPIGLKRVASSYLSPSLTNCHNESSQHGGQNGENDNRVKLNQQDEDALKRVHNCSLLLVVVGAVLISFGKSFSFSSSLFIGVSLFFSGLGLFVGAEVVRPERRFSPRR